MHLESRIVQQCQQIVNALSYFCNFQQCCDDVLGVCRRPCFVEILQDSDNKWFHNIPNLCGICLELIQWLHSTCKYMININPFWIFQSWLYSLYSNTMLKWTHTVPHTFWAHLMVANPFLFRRPWPPSHVTEATWQIRSHEGQIWFAGATVQLSNFPKTLKHPKTFPRTGCQLVNNLAFELVTFLNCSFFKTSMPLSA